MASISVEDLKKMKVNDLKKELKDRGLSMSGTKDVLLERLTTAVTGAPVTEPVEGAPVVSSDVTDVDNVEKSIDQLVGDAAPPAQPPVQAVTPEVQAPAKENIPKIEVSEPETKVAPLKGLSEEERLKVRAEKFGASTETAKKQKRAERFGIEAPTTDSTKEAPTAEAPDMDKLKKRAERFGTVVSNSLSKVDEDEKKRKRLERFGPMVSSTAGEAGEAGEAKKIKLNSTDSDLEAKKKQRAQRFGLT